MHIDHDHIAGGEHNHQHTHAHSHEHTHDGHTHTHEHHHEHAHSHEHPHSHDHLHEHGHEHNHTHTPMDELVALMKYMVGHNAAHAKELADLAAKLDQAGNKMAFEQVMAAVSDFEKGNMRLSLVLTALDVK